MSGWRLPPEDEIVRRLTPEDRIRWIARRLRYTAYIMVGLVSLIYIFIGWLGLSSATPTDTFDFILGAFPLYIAVAAAVWVVRRANRWERAQLEALRLRRCDTHATDLNGIQQDAIKP
jgi:hypothetical protein